MDAQYCDIEGLLTSTQPFRDVDAGTRDDRYVAEVPSQD